MKRALQKLITFLYWKCRAFEVDEYPKNLAIYFIPSGIASPGSEVLVGKINDAIDAGEELRFELLGSYVRTEAGEYEPTD